MKCKYCEQPPVFHRKISNEMVCKVHFIKTIEKKIRKTVSKFSMFTPQDKVVVGVSGGKDSIALLWNIKILQERSPKAPQIEAILIDEGITGYREESTKIAKDICDEWGIPLHIVSFQEAFGARLDNVIEKLKTQDMNACTVCGTVRRRLLNDKARELGAEKLAIGHNLDDQVETFLQNILRNDIPKLTSNPPQGNPIDPTGIFIPRVKPLMEIPESEIVLYCLYKNFPIQTTPCPYVEGFSILRKKVQDFLNDLEKRSAEVKYNLMKANLELYSQLQREKNEPELNFTDNLTAEEKRIKKKCTNCEQPMGHQRAKCHYCHLKDILKI